MEQADLHVAGEADTEAASVQTAQGYSHINHNDQPPRPPQQDRADDSPSPVRHWQPVPNRKGRDANALSYFTLEIQFYIGYNLVSNGDLQSFKILEQGFIKLIGSNRKALLFQIWMVGAKFNQNGRPQTEKYIIQSGLMCYYLMFTAMRLTPNSSIIRFWYFAGLDLCPKDIQLEICLMHFTPKFWLKYSCFLKNPWFYKPTVNHQTFWNPVSKQSKKSFLNSGYIDDPYIFNQPISFTCTTKDLVLKCNIFDVLYTKNLHIQVNYFFFFKSSKLIVIEVISLFQGLFLK